MEIRSSLYPAAFSGALWFTMLAGSASADMISPGMMDSSGQTYSQGMMVESGAWAGEIYSQGMMMSTGDIYTPGVELTTFAGTTNSHETDAAAYLGGRQIPTPPSQDCAGTASNCTNNVTNTPAISGFLGRQSARKPGFAADWRHPYRERRPDPRACQPGLARLGSPLVGFGAATAQPNVKKTDAPKIGTAPSGAAFASNPQLRHSRVRGWTGFSNGRPSARARRYSRFSR